MTFLINILSQSFRVDTVSHSIVKELISSIVLTYLRVRVFSAEACAQSLQYSNILCVVLDVPAHPWNVVQKRVDLTAEVTIVEDVLTLFVWREAIGL